MLLPGLELWRLKMDKYFEELRKRVDEEYEIANRARALGKDLSDKVEISLATSLAERVVNLIATVYPRLPVAKISGRILELEEEYGKLDAMISFVIAREIAEGKFCKFADKLEGIDIGIRVGFAYMTLGVVASPIEGYTGLRLGKTRDGRDYFIVNFSGPIRSAGTTATCLVLMLIDYLREYFGYAKYDVSEEEIRRYVVENTDFHEKVSNLQYFPTEEEMVFLASHLPIQIDGDPTESLEVSNHKGLSRVATDFIRGGMCLTFSEGLAQKAGKALGRLKSCKDNGLEYSGFDWLEDYLVLHKKAEHGEKDVVATYIKDLVAGRPVYGHPSRSGSFRFRYGRSRTSGFSAVSVHSATMGISNGFLSNGTQLKIEKPTKGCIITSCDSIDGPIVKFKDGSVRKLTSFDKAKNLWDDVEEIIYLGDILFPLGDVKDRNADLPRAGYVEEWWGAEVVEKGGKVMDIRKVSFEEAIEFSEKLGIPLHPDFIFYWTQLSYEDFFGLSRWINGSVWRDGKLVLPWSGSVREGFAVGKRALEILGVEHSIVLDNVVVEKDARALLFNLGIEDLYNGEVLEMKVDEVDDRPVLEIVNFLCKFEVKDKAGSFIGARMARPEKAKLRVVPGSPNVLFPVGEQGGRLKSVQEAVATGFVKSDFPIYKCDCGSEGINSVCEKCGGNAKRFVFCRECGEAKEGGCKFHKDCFKFSNRRVDIKSCFEKAVLDLGYEDYEVPPMVKGVDRLSSDGKDTENLAKGILRAKFGLFVNKDGTVRYDATEIPLTHFRPVEIGTSVERLKELGYERDIKGKELIDVNQILELMPHDVVLPSCSESKEESADVSFFNIASFVDEELSRLYKLPKYYNVNCKDDLVGQLVACMAPHNCASVVGRIIGFGEMQGLLASPYMHAAMRRDCDGDEASVMLLMDVLLNFSRKFLPSHRGGSQDAPLVLNTRIRAGEVDDQILSFECCSEYPLELYRLAEKGAHSSEIKIDNVWERLKSGRDTFVGAGFTHDTSNFNTGNNNGAYKTLPSMKEKVAAQMELVKKIRAVDTDDVARLILERHFIRDIRGNLRKFCKQGFRCSKCNRKFRRIPLRGNCDKCEGKIIFTISEGSVKKYLEPAMELVRGYNISEYTRENMELIKEYVDSVFGSEEQMRL